MYQHLSHNEAIRVLIAVYAEHMLSECFAACRQTIAYKQSALSFVSATQKQLGLVLCGAYIVCKQPEGVYSEPCETSNNIEP